MSVEYSTILAEKRKLYEEYRERRKEMINYQIAKQDIDRFLKIYEEQFSRGQFWGIVGYPSNKQMSYIGLQDTACQY